MTCAGSIDHVHPGALRHLARPRLVQQRPPQEHRAPVGQRQPRLQPRPAAGEASTTTVPSARPDITALRSGKLLRVGGASGQNCETTAPSAAIRRWSAAFSGG